MELTMTKIDKKKIASFVVGIAVPLTVGIISAAISREGYAAYKEITKPPLSPPALAFPIAWTILYVLMGVSSAIIFNNKEKNPEEARRGLRLYAISLAANFLWSIIFFKFGAFLFALICLLIMLFYIIKTILSYRSISPLAAYLQIPYALWVAFAGYLNAGVFLLNM